MKITENLPSLDYPATLQAIFNSRAHSILLIDREGRILAFNEGAAKAAREIQGMEYEVGKDFLSGVSAKVKAKVQERFDRILAGESLHLEIPYQGVDGVEHWYDLQYDPVRNGAGTVTGICLTSICIDERKKVEQSLRESEEKFRKLFEEAPAPMAMVSDYRFIKANRAFQDLLGYSEDELNGKTLFDITHPDDLPKTREIATAVHEGQKDTFQSEKRYLRKNGQALWAIVSGTVIRDRAGQKLYSLIIIQNITERKTAQEALRKSEADLRAVFNSGSQLVILLSPDGRILDCNNSAMTYMERMTGKKVEKGRPFTDYMENNKVYHKEFELHQSQALAGEVVSLDRVIKSADGSEFWLGVSYNPVHDAAGKITGVCMTALPIDERKKAEEALRRSEADLKAIFNSGSNVMVLIGRDGQVNGFNKTAGAMAARVLGREIKLGMMFADTLPAGASLELFQKSFTAALEGKETKGERVIQAADGQERWVEVNYQPVTSAEGKVEGVCFSLAFIDERKKAERALRESEDRYRRLVEFSPEAVVVHAEGRILYMNSSGIKMLGDPPPEKIIGKSILDFVHPDYREVSLSRVQKITKNGEPTEWTEQKLVRIDGQVLDTETKGTPFIFQGRPAVLTIVRDVTDRKRTQGILLRYERLAAVGNVIAAIAHEIRNPLAVVSGMSQILKEKLEHRTEFSTEISTILTQTERLKLFMNDILDYSREMEIKKEVIDISDLLERSLATAQTQFGPAHTRIQVKRELEKTLPEFWADGERLEQVLVNLILNAYQAMKEKGTLTLSCEVRDQWLYLGVKDDGPGIDEADLSHLFEPFFTTKKHGSGLGLSISQKIVEAHGGKIEVRRIQPAGILVTIQLPLQKV